MYDAADADANPDGDPAPSPQTTPGIDEMLAPSPLLTRTTATDSTSTPPAAPVGTGKDAPLPFAPARKPPKTQTRWFQVTVDRSRAIHQDYIERQPLWKHFEPMRSVAQIDLAGKVPHVGLSNVSKRPPHAYRTPNKVLAGMNRHLQFGRESLVKMWEEGEGGRQMPGR